MWWNNSYSNYQQLLHGMVSVKGKAFGDHVTLVSAVLSGDSDYTDYATVWLLMKPQRTQTEGQIISLEYPTQGIGGKSDSLFGRV